MTWRTAALCADTVTSPADDLWFSDDPADIATARRICGRCPSRQVCVQEATSRGLEGMWGGQIHEPAPAAPSDDRDVKMRDLYDAGHTDTEIGEHVGMDREQVRNWRRRNGLVSDRNSAQRLALYGAGHNDAHIAAVEGVGRHAISKWRKRHDLPTKHPKRGAA